MAGAATGVEEEDLTLVIRGAGIDYDREFDDVHQLISATQSLVLTATGAGTVEYFVTKHPYAVSFDTGRIEARTEGCVPAPADNQHPNSDWANANQPPGDADDEPDGDGLCSTSGVASPQLVGLGMTAPLLAVWLARRRRG